MWSVPGTFIDMGLADQITFKYCIRKFKVRTILPYGRVKKIVLMGKKDFLRKQVFMIHGVRL